MLLSGPNASLVLLRDPILLHDSSYELMQFEEESFETTQDRQLSMQ